MKKFFIILLLAAFVSCSTQTVDIKSPCVSNDDGPCGPKKPINDWWINQQII